MVTHEASSLAAIVASTIAIYAIEWTYGNKNNDDDDDRDKIDDRNKDTKHDATKKLPPIASSEWFGEDGLNLYILSFMDASEVDRNKIVSKRWNVLCTKTMNENFSPKKCFESSDELRLAVKKYCGDHLEKFDEVTRTYGYPIDKWDVSKNEDFSRAFRLMDNFNEYIGSWDISSAKSLKEMFYGATIFNQPLHSWDVSNVKTMARMFEDARAFNQRLEMWNTQNGKRVKKMFLCAVSFNQPIAGWNLCSC